MQLIRLSHQRPLLASVCVTGNEMPCSHLVVFRGGDEEEDGGDRVETLEPAPPLRPLPSHVHHLEGNILDLKVILVDALGGFTGQQDVLLSGEVTLHEGRKDKTNESQHAQEMVVRQNTI